MDGAEGRRVVNGMVEVSVNQDDNLVVVDASNGCKISVSPRVALQLADRLTLAAEALEGSYGNRRVAA